MHRDVREISDSIIAVIDAFPELLLFIRNEMSIVVHSSISEVESANEGNFLVDDNNFFVMGPQEGNEHVIGMSKNLNIWVQRFQIALCELWVDVNGDSWGVVNNDIDFDSLKS